jgi:hypothetical protein
LDNSVGNASRSSSSIFKSDYVSALGEDIISARLTIS